MALLCIRERQSLLVRSLRASETDRCAGFAWIRSCCCGAGWRYASYVYGCEWAVHAGWQALSRDLGRDALSADSACLLAGSSADGAGDGVEHDYDVCVLERARGAAGQV